MGRLGPAAVAMAALASAARAEDPVPAELLASVGEYLACRDDAKAKSLEKAFADRPFDLLVRAVREAPWGEPAESGDIEFSMTVPGSGEPFTVFVRLPDGYDGKTEFPAIVSMHGTDPAGGARGERDRWARQLNAGTFVVVCPEETPALWGKGWGSTEAERQLNLAAIAECLRRFRIDPDRVFLAGVSRGGHATWEIGLLYPDRFAGLYANAGGPRLLNFGYFENLGKLPLLESIGGQDQANLVGNVRAGCARLKDLGGEIDLREHPDAGHGVGYGDDPAFVAWVLSRRRNPFPEKLVHRFGRLSQGRSGWLEATRLESGVKDPAEEPLSVRTKAGQKPSEEELRRLYVEALDGKLARLEGSIAENRVEVRGKRVAEVLVYFPAERLDFTKPIELRIEGKKRFSRILPPDGVRMLRHVRETGDRARIVGWAEKFSVN